MVLMERRLRTSESFVAGTAAMVVATAVLGLVPLVQASFPFPPLGLAQRLLRAFVGGAARRGQAFWRRSAEPVGFGGPGSAAG